MVRIRFSLAAAVIGGLLCTLATLATAQEWPQRTVKFIVPFGAGSATDAAARMMSEKLAARWGKPVVVENKPGGDGLVAINSFLSANDDHVLLYSSSGSFNAHPYMQAKLPYDRERDFAPIARVADTVLSVSVPGDSPAKTLAEFVALAKSQPGKLNVAASPGVADFTLGYFVKTESLDVQKVPYRDIVPAAVDLSVGQIQFLYSGASIVRPLHEAGKVRMLAVTSSERAAFAPEVPTVHEAGFPSLWAETTAGLFGPRSMPQPLRERIAKDLIEVMSDKTVTDRLVATGQSVKLAGPDALTQVLKQQAELTAKVASALGLKAAAK